MQPEEYKGLRLCAHGGFLLPERDFIEPGSLEIRLLSLRMWNRPRPGSGQKMCLLGSLPGAHYDFAPIPRQRSLGMCAPDVEPVCQCFRRVIEYPMRPIERMGLPVSVSGTYWPGCRRRPLIYLDLSSDPNSIGRQVPHSRIANCGPRIDS